MKLNVSTIHLCLFRKQLNIIYHASLPKAEIRVNLTQRALNPSCEPLFEFRGSDSGLPAFADCVSETELRNGSWVAADPTGKGVTGFLRDGGRRWTLAVPDCWRAEQWQGCMKAMDRCVGGCSGGAGSEEAAGDTGRLAVGGERMGSHREKVIFIFGWGEVRDESARFESCGYHPSSLD